MSYKIRIISPSGVIEPELVYKSASFLRSRGFDVSISAHACGSYGRFSGTAEERLSDLNEALCDPELDYILCSRGGYGLVQIIDRVVVPEDRCPTVVGFSDITALHNLMGCHGKPSVHGVMCKHIAEYDSRTEAVEQLLHVLTKDTIDYRLPSHPHNKTGAVEGTIRGGNLSVLYGLQGTPYATPINAGDILLIEDIGEHPYAIDRMMHNLRLSGVLSRLGGLIVGQFSDCEEDPRMPYTIYEGIKRLTEPYNYPVVFNFPAGHVADNRPVILNREGCILTVDNDKTTLHIPDKKNV
ncbi:MAG: LD-carboxypeptidase [Paludibacteraceae bacterium]|nr:LD-carboxypeptidase [Paludibacteraceae bacterium]